MTQDYQELLAAGTVLRSEYVEKLKEIGIQEVYVKDTETESVVILKKDIEENVKHQVKDILQKHTYSHNQELMELNKTADNIIDSILDEREVVTRVYDIKERSSDIYEHSLSTCTLAILTAIKMNLGHESIHDIGIACLLHEIGLRYLTIDYDNQDVSKLSEKDRVEYKKHPVYGYTALKNENWISKRSKEIILSHHELLDGSGYPLKTREMTVENRIVSICDTFDEMICGIGKNRVKVHSAVEYLKSFKNIKFDGKIVDVFLEFTAVYPAGSLVKTNEGEVGIVMRQNKDCPDRPVLRIVQDHFGNKIAIDVIKDLSVNNTIYIENVVD